VWLAEKLCLQKFKRVVSNVAYSEFGYYAMGLFFRCDIIEDGFKTSLLVYLQEPVCVLSYSIACDDRST
jgi:hypothetical protein